MRPAEPVDSFFVVRVPARASDDSKSLTESADSNSTKAYKQQACYSLGEDNSSLFYYTNEFHEIDLDDEYMYM